jgi:phage-related protein
MLHVPIDTVASIIGVMYVALLMGRFVVLFHCQLLV